MDTPYTRLINPYKNLTSSFQKKVEVIDLPENNATVSVVGQTTKNPVIAPTSQQKAAASVSVAPKGEVSNIQGQVNALNKSTQKTIYRIGGNIYDASTNQKIPNVATLESQYSGAKEVSAPTTQTTQITPFTSTGIAGDLGGTTEQKQKTTPTYGIQETKPISTINTLQQQLANIQSQIAARQTEAEQAKINLMAGQTALEGQGRAIPLSLIRGQQAKLQTQAELDELTKATELAGLQRQEAGLISQLQSQQQLAQPLTAGNEIIRYNPDTGQYETIYKGTEAATPMKVGAGETVINPITGEVIYESPEEVEADPNTIGTAETGYYQYDANTKTWNQVVQPAVKPEELTYKQRVDLEVKLANDFEKYVKESRQSVNQLGIMETAWDTIVNGMETGYITNPYTGKQEKFNLNAPSQAMLVTFQKLLDPTSVVRESEYARSGDGQALKQRIEGIYDKLNRGGAGVTVQDLQQFYSLSQSLLKNYQEQQLNFAKRTKTQANNYNLNLENILTPDVIGSLGVQAGDGIGTEAVKGGQYSWD